MAWIGAVVGVVQGLVDRKRAGDEVTAAGQNNMLMALYRAQNTNAASPTGTQSGSNPGTTNATTNSAAEAARAMGMA